MNRIETMEAYKPNPELIELTKMVVQQNASVLEMNAKLLPQIASAMSMVVVSGASNARRDLYTELATALGCDEMDSHDGRLMRARRLAGKA